jgi:cytoskeleton protein RodZ
MAEEQSRVAELPLESVGVRLRIARESKGLSRSDIASRTKVAERHLAAIEEGRFADLASSTYAIGFFRAYARTVGLNEREIADAVRTELGQAEAFEPRPTAQGFEPGDPARIPASRTAWTAALAALAVLAVLFFLWRSYLVPGAALPDLTREPARAPQAVAAGRAPAAAAPSGAVPPGPAAGGPVVFTSTDAGIWVKF